MVNLTCGRLRAMGHHVPLCILCSFCWFLSNSPELPYWQGTTQKLVSFCWHHHGAVFGYNKLQTVRQPEWKKNRPLSFVLREEKGKLTERKLNEAIQTIFLYTDWCVDDFIADATPAFKLKIIPVWKRHLPIYNVTMTTMNSPAASRISVTASCFSIICSNLPFSH